MAPTATTDEDLDIEASFLTFASEVLGLDVYEWQADALEPFDDASERLVQVSLATPNGSGKSAVVITTLVLGWLAMYPMGRVVVTTADGKQLDGQIMPAIESHRAKFPAWTFLNRHISTPTGGRFFAFTTDQAGRAEGWHKLDDTTGPLLMIVDEAKTVPEDIFTAIDRCTFNAILLASSPGKMSGTFYRSQTEPSLGYNAIKVGLKDCPHITQDKIDRIIAKHGANSPFTRSSLHGEFLEFFEGQPVFYAYSAQVHEHESLGWINGATLAVGMDPGTHNASTIAAVKKDRGGNIHLWALREIILESSDTDRQMIALLQALAMHYPFWNSALPICPQTVFFCDPAARNSAFTTRGPTSSAYKVMQSHGIHPGFKIGLQLQPSIATVNRLLQKNHVDAKGTVHWHFKIDKTNCPILAGAMRAKYRYAARGEAGWDSDKPLKGDACDGVDHVCFVVVTEVLTLTGTRPIDCIKTGDIVWTRSGPRPVVATGSRMALVKSYEFSNGRRIQCTEDHPFWSESRRMMIRVDDLTHGDILCECTHAQKLLSIAGKFIAVTLTRIDAATAFISRITRRIFTTKSGRTTTAQDQRDITFTTKTRTQEITILETWNSSPQSSILEGTQRHRAAQQPQNDAMPFARSQRHGTHLQKAGSGIASMPQRKGLEPCPRQDATATTVAKNISLSERADAPPLRGSVPTAANLRGVARAIWTMWIKAASCAANLFARIGISKRNAVRVVAGQNSETKSARVYNLTIDGDHEFYANGILVSNCDSFRYMVCNILDISSEDHPSGMRTNYPTPVNPEMPRRI